jgi:hypothetical protein
MWGHVLAILALVVLCGAWVLFQRWLGRVDPDGQTIEDRCGGCGSCTRQCRTSDKETR